MFKMAHQGMHMDKTFKKFINIISHANVGQAGNESQGNRLGVMQ